MALPWYGSKGEWSVTRVKIALASDTLYLRHAIVAMTSVLDKAVRGTTVHFLGDGLTIEAKKTVESACALHSAEELIFHDVAHVLPDRRNFGTRTRAALARLHIPRLVDGRVLYLDGDTLTRTDVSPLFDMNMDGNLVGAVRDFGVLNKSRKRNPDAVRETRQSRQLMDPLPLYNYFNSGVVLFDCDEIRRNEAAVAALMDIGEIEDTLYLDQDHLNSVMKGRVKHLHPSWNAFYGLGRHVRRVARDTMPRKLVHDLQESKIIHYVHGQKPMGRFDVRWLAKTSFVFRRLPQYIEYKRRTKYLTAPHEAALKEIERAS